MIIRVLIADDHGVLGESLRFLIEAQRNMAVVALARDGRDAVRRAVAMKPDVVVMDSVHVERALRAGASGYVLKASPADEVVRAIRTRSSSRCSMSRTP
jgi:DNA-binding NarL/FixJ family response regulator